MNDLVERARDNTKFETWEDLTGLIAELADEVERLRETEEAYRELFKRSCEKTVYIAECEAEIERLRVENERLRHKADMAEQAKQMQK